MLEVHVDTTRLYDGEDTNYELWIATIVEMVYESKRKQEREVKKKLKT